MINSNRRHIPVEMKTAEGRQEKSTMFCHSDSVIFASYHCKGSRLVLVVSAIHKNGVDSEEEPHKARNNSILQQHKGRF